LAYTTRNDEEHEDRVKSRWFRVLVEFEFSFIVEMRLEMNVAGGDTSRDERRAHGIAKIIGEFHLIIPGIFCTLFRCVTEKYVIVTLGLVLRLRLRLRLGLEARFGFGIGLGLGSLNTWDGLKLVLESGGFGVMFHHGLRIWFHHRLWL
jgi:hypothetical protein